jgi:hypothetical protein
MADLTAFGAGSYGDAEFIYTMQLFEPVVPPGVPSPIATTTSIVGCRVTGVDEKQEMGSDELVTEVSAQGLYLVRTVGGLPLKLWSTLRTLL